MGGQNQVYLDLTHIPAQKLTEKLGAILEIYEMFVGDDPRYVPMRIFPGVHYSMGGLWVDFEQRTNIRDYLLPEKPIIQSTELTDLGQIH